MHARGALVCLPIRLSIRETKMRITNVSDVGHDDADRCIYYLRISRDAQASR